MARGYTRLSECASRVIVEKLLERLATSDKTTIVIERQPDGKIRVTSNSWGDEAKVFMRDQVLELLVALRSAACTSLAKPNARTSGTRRSRSTTRIGLGRRSSRTETVFHARMKRCFTNER